jgi:ABC-type transporter Mla subunit MlaD
MTRERRVGLTLLVAGIFIALIAVAVVVSRETKTLYYTISFKDAKGVQDGDRVQMTGVDIGVVKWHRLNSPPTTVDVRVKIFPEHAEKVRVGSTAIIRDVSFPNVSGQRVIEIVNPDVEPLPPPLPKDSTVYGMNSSIELELWKFKHLLRGAGDGASQIISALAENMKNLSETVRDIATSPEVQKAMADLQDFLKKMNQRGREAADELRLEWPRIQQELQPALKELQEFGRVYVVDQIRQMMAQIQKTLDEWTGPMPPPSRPSPTTTPR